MKFFNHCRVTSHISFYGINLQSPDFFNDSNVTKSTSSASSIKTDDISWPRLSDSVSFIVSPIRPSGKKIVFSLNPRLSKYPANKSSAPCNLEPSRVHFDLSTFVVPTDLPLPQL